VWQSGAYELPSGSYESMAPPSDFGTRQQLAATAPSDYGMPNNLEDDSSSNPCRGAPLSPFSLVDPKAREAQSRTSATTSTGSSAGTSLYQNSWTDCHFLPQQSDYRVTALRQSLQSKMTSIRKGFELQRSFIAELFFCYEPQTFEELFTDLTGDPRFPIASSMLCEMCAVAVAAGQYVRDLIEPDVLDCWYGKS